MSTKAIREALQALADAEPGASDGAEQRRLVSAALGEVEAIEKASKSMAAMPTGPYGPRNGPEQFNQWKTAHLLWQAIAKEAP